MFEARTALIVPALDEEAALAGTLAEIPRGLYRQTIVVDNGSADRTAEVARRAGATVVSEPRRGYGSACLAGIAALAPEIEIVVFMDADGASDPGEAERLLGPIRSGEADLVLGSRVLGPAEAGALEPHQRWGNRVATEAIAACFGRRFSDLGPFRAIRRASLDALGMRDTGYGWTIEMQVRAVRRGLRIVEAPVAARRRRGGRSKISGDWRASIAAGCKILWTVARLRAA